MRSADMKHMVLISPTDSKLIDALSALDVDIITTKPVSGLYDNEKYHADIQCLVIDKSVFVYDQCKSLANDISKFFNGVYFCENPKQEYPLNVSLNALYAGGKLFCREVALDLKVRKYCDEHSVKIINVRQGYTKCSSLVLSDSSIVTADPTVCKAARENSLDVLLISAGNIYLENTDYGFIGGSCGVIGDTVYFFGDINKHPDGKEIISFIENHKHKYVSLTDDILHDVGGFVVIN